MICDKCGGVKTKPGEKIIPNIMTCDCVMSPLEQFQMVTELVRRIDKCPECGHEEEQGLLSPEEARRILGLPKLPSGDNEH